MTRTISLALAALLATAGSASAQEKFTFALNWFAVGDHAAYWVALDKGYYKAKGLDVTLENSKGSGDSIAKVDTGLAQIVDLKFFCGFSFAEIAAMRGVSERTIQRNWEKGRLYLHHAIGSGSPAPVSANAAYQP